MDLRVIISVKIADKEGPDLLGITNFGISVKTDSLAIGEKIMESLKFLTDEKGEKIPEFVYINISN